MLALRSQTSPRNKLSIHTHTHTRTEPMMSYPKAKLLSAKAGSHFTCLTIRNITNPVPPDTWHLPPARLRSTWKPGRGRNARSNKALKCMLLVQHVTLPGSGIVASFPAEPPHGPKKRRCPLQPQRCPILFLCSTWLELLYPLDPLG